jgi:arylformamidase
MQLKHKREILDADFNNRARVPDHQEQFDNWDKFSATARELWNCTLDVAYGSKSSEKLDIFHADKTNAPVLVFIHGGYWQASDKAQFSFIANGFIPSKISVILLNHTLAPEVGIDEIVEQVRNAIAWTYRHGPEFSLDPNQIFVSGHSSGGHLTAMLISTPWPDISPDLPHNIIKGACILSGLFDLEPIRISSLNDILRMDEKTAARNSPLYLLPGNPIRLIMSVGGLESKEFLRQSQQFEEAWKARGYPLEKIHMPDCNHYSIVTELGKPENALNSAVRKQIGFSPLS